MRLSLPPGALGSKFTLGVQLELRQPDHDLATSGFVSVELRWCPAPAGAVEPVHHSGWREPHFV